MMQLMKQVLPKLIRPRRPKNTEDSVIQGQDGYGRGHVLKNVL